MARKNVALAVAENPQEEPQKSRDFKIPPLRQQVIAFKLESTTPLLMNRFPEKARIMMAEKMQQGQAARSKRTRDPRDFNKDMESARHTFHDNPKRSGYPASAWRAAMVSACRSAGYKMTHAKQAITVLSDGLATDGVPLVEIVGKYELSVLPARNATGVMDLRARPMFREWRATIRVQYDADLLGPDDVFNLMTRAGAQVGLGDGRPDSRQSAGLGFGTFKIVATGE